MYIVVAWCELLHQPHYKGLVRKTITDGMHNIEQHERVSLCHANKVQLIHSSYVYLFSIEIHGQYVKASPSHPDVLPAEHPNLLSCMPHPPTTLQHRGRDYSVFVRAEPL